MSAFTVLALCLCITLCCQHSVFLCYCLSMNTHKVRSLVLLVIVYIALLAMVFMTNPRKLPIIILIVPFILVFAAVFLSVNLAVRRFFPRVVRPRRLFIAGCSAGLPTLLLILSSINQLTWRDAFLLIVLAVFLLFYSSRLEFLKK